MEYEVQKEIDKLINKLGNNDITGKAFMFNEEMTEFELRELLIEYSKQLSTDVIYTFESNQRYECEELSEFLDNYFEVKSEEIELVQLTWSTIKNLDWNKFCNITGTYYYYQNEFSPNDSDIWRITKSQFNQLFK